MKKCVCLCLIKAVKKQDILFERCSTRIMMKNSDENSVENSDQNSDQNIFKLKYLLEKRDLIVAEFLKTKNNIQRNQLAERLGEQDAMAEFTRQ